ncbi:DUF3311 domain-containing protein [Alteribacillus iranensis]|uniref:DUF3311 domain-containing protein n=1 Tax=Alteribacillus iranensis TaxID=930128 RepID=A0A1I2CXF0_9BACI|nr:DUF3311 domain-containing protein [Alteribacillus iranensis]SFE72443.1 Protein of unknown function [Alteribacillus iranensis]
MSKKRFYTIYISVTCITFLMTIFPIFEIANRAEPIIIGLPFNFFWVVMWIVITFLAVLTLYFKDPDVDEGWGEE